MIRNLILAGGIGSRLWPLSRELFPKQFMKIFNNKSLFQETLLRNSTIIDKTDIITNREHFFLVIDHISRLKDLKAEINKIIIEPVGRNTASAITLEALSSKEDDILLITPSDHLIEGHYKELIKHALELVNNDHLVIFGIKANKPDTSYGYIEANGNDVIKFHEKPSVEKAKEYVKKGYLWNLGIFMFKAKTVLDEIRSYDYEVYRRSFDALNNALKKDYSDFELIEIKEDYMNLIPNISFDKAVLEKADKVKVIDAYKFIKWNDLGSYDSLIESYKENININNNDNIKKLEHFININSNNNFLYSDSKEKLISLIDVNDLIVVDTSDALLISKKGSSEKVKDIVKEIKKLDLPHYKLHKRVYRPWGYYEVLMEKKNYKIKRIYVKPNRRLSLQKHMYRNEHWIVVKGKANIIMDNKEFILRENESVYVKKEQPHRIENKTNRPLVIIEIQTGNYLGEDDIIRIEDDFDRK